MGDLQQDQQGLRDRLKKLQDELAKRGMGPASAARARASAVNRVSRARASKVRAATRATARTGSIRPIPRWAMPPAGFGDGNADGAVDPQGPRAGSAAQGRPEPCRSHAAGRRRSAGRRPRSIPGGRQQGAAELPRIRSAGRCVTTSSATTTPSKIPGEIDVQRVRRILEELRRRLADPARPQIELDLHRAAAEGLLRLPKGAATVVTREGG